MARPYHRKASRAVHPEIPQVVHDRPVGDWAIGDRLWAFEMVSTAMRRLGDPCSIRVFLWGISTIDTPPYHTITQKKRVERALFLCNITHFSCVCAFFVVPLQRKFE